MLELGSCAADGSLASLGSARVLASGQHQDMSVFTRGQFLQDILEFQLLDSVGQHPRRSVPGVFKTY